MTNFVFIAPPAAGKGTQSKMLVEKYGYEHVSTGDLLREEIAKKTELGMQINEVISAGKLVNDELVLKMLKAKLKSIINDNKSFIIDGFPRTFNQAKLLEEVLTSLNNEDYKVIYMDLDYEEAKNRVLGRLMCLNCGKSYNDKITSLMPKVEGKCDSCGSLLEKRSDDTEETFKVRFDTFIESTKPIIEFYNSNNKLINIDANKSAEDIFKNIETYVTEVK